MHVVYVFYYAFLLFVFSTVLYVFYCLLVLLFVLFVALITALKNLQEKVRGLELERAAAAERYKTLKEDADRQLRESSPKRVEEKAVQSSPFVAREHSSHVPLNDSMHTSEFVY